MSEWTRSSFCNTDHVTGNCAEVKRAPGVVAVRNSTRPEVQVVFTNAEWDALVAGVKAGEFDV